MIKALRKEIFKWGAYVEVYLEDGKDWKYDTEIDKYRTKYREEESYNAIPIAYFVLSVVCFALSVSLYFLYKFPHSFPNLLYLVAILAFAIVTGWLYKRWWDSYKDIPVETRKEYILRWQETKKRKGDNEQEQNSGDL